MADPAARRVSLPADAYSRAAHCECDPDATARRSLDASAPRRDAAARPRGILRPYRASIDAASRPGSPLGSSQPPPPASPPSPSSAAKRFSFPASAPTHRPRYASVNIPLAASAFAHDIDGDRLARACGQAPLFHYPRYDQPPGRDSMYFSPASPSSSAMTRKSGSDSSVLGERERRDSAPPPPPLPVPNVRKAYRQLDLALRAMGVNVKEILALPEVLAIHEEDEEEQADASTSSSRRVFGVAIRKSMAYASTTAVIAGYTQRLPVVAHACVEQLYKTGIYQPHLFRALPSRARHMALISLYDTPPSFGAAHSLRAERTEDVCALLLTYLCSLPAPVLPREVGAGLWAWCVAPCDSDGDSKRGEDEEKRVTVAQLLLRLLPRENLSLLTYLLSFFTQIPLSPENGMLPGDVARMFGWRVLGGGLLAPKGDLRALNAKEREREREREEKRRGEEMLGWVMERWGAIYEGLFGESGSGLDRGNSKSERQRAGERDGGRPGLERRSSQRERAERRDGRAPYVSPRAGHRRLASENLSLAPDEGSSASSISSPASEFGDGRVGLGVGLVGDSVPPDFVLNGAFEPKKGSLVRGDSASVYSVMTGFGEYDVPDSAVSFDRLVFPGKSEHDLDRENRTTTQPPPRLLDVDVTAPDTDGLDWCDLLVPREGRGEEERELRKELECVRGERDQQRRILQEIRKLVETS
ncbi:hypothetical protein GLOTRDRAFT_138964 [Gloeophyllum trabeum ATCC 11539]|uniref:Rho-GAP domain-containing protein n=1 Tax=Gloeophyllum trabeum (strain ATCC 11539 / FP-39264 / Madison 617) TaxID=670483 RepID=S7Q7B6_GLOTA|nr:uncharacterized protein GLOTRDRAFT_138964 [Gloeophyllum trabeum ATCC 11539]EPQ55422.1 hypothetical protein GLOTRDRAFT_138964 [Gloeophyllum trabeum ATCC 11539]